MIEHMPTTPFATGSNLGEHPADAAPMEPARNVVFLSPQFPNWVTKFAVALGSHENVNVLGIGDDTYDSLPAELKNSLTEYYRVNDMEDHDEVLRAVGFYTHKYGKLDRFESLNEHWLELEAKIRKDFNIAGPRPSFIEKARRKSLMKEVFEGAGVATIQGTVAYNMADALTFTAKHGYPVVIKPDSGSGAASTSRVDDDDALISVFDSLPANTGPVVVEQYMDANILTYDGLVDANGQIIFENTARCDQSIMEVVNAGGNAYYVGLPDVPENVRAVGSAIVSAYGLRERFFHIEIFERRDNGKLVGLEMNMRPPGAWMTDAMNISHSTDVYQRWAAMVAGVAQPVDGPDKFFAPYASRKNFLTYAHTHAEVEDYLGDSLVIYSPIERVLQAAMGDEAYLSRANSYDQALRMIDYVQERA
jgi:hypothetical protein